ncbi:unnamed protein product, partial [Sphenostylis stenocarpa]
MFRLRSGMQMLEIVSIEKSSVPIIDVGLETNKASVADVDVDSGHINPPNISLALDSLR